MESESENGLAGIWQKQPVESVEITPEQLRRRARQFGKQVLWRNLREYAACAAVVGLFGYYVWRFPAPLVRLGCALVIAGVLFVVRALHKRGAAKTVAVEMAFSTFLEFHRHQLERQRDLASGVWTWYLLPFVPGMVVFLFGLLLWTLEQPGAPADTRGILIAFCLAAAGCGLVLFGVWKLNQRAARRLQREIDVLDALGKES